MLKIFIFKEKGVVKSEKGDGVLLYNYKLTLLKKTFIMINTGGLCIMLFYQTIVLCVFEY